MQGTKIRLLAGGLLMMATAGYVQADALQPDPAWQQGTLSNGLQWQVLTTPQRPSDRVEIRLLVNTGSLAESTQQSGYSHAIPRIALTQSGGLEAAQARSLWQQGIDPKRPMPPVIVSYDTTLFNLSLPNNRNDLLKEALS
ncbi:insulinase family protein, partial [Salmonella enterica subsp. enterica serovar Bareilly]|nr:insulinase family protein [Salmonella enterica subsp. enterica serovar Bareilly]